MRRKDRILPGYKDLKGLARGLMQEQEIEIDVEDFEDIIRTSLQRMNDDDKNYFFKSLEKVGLISVERAIQYCRSKGFNDMAGWLKIQDAWERSQKGNLYDKKKN